MKKVFGPLWIAIVAMTILPGCVSLDFGRLWNPTPSSPTAGQELIDLKRAQDLGVITEAEFEAEKAKIVGKK